MSTPYNGIDLGDNDPLEAGGFVTYISADSTEDEISDAMDQAALELVPASRPESAFVTSELTDKGYRIKATYTPQ